MSTRVILLILAGLLLIALAYLLSPTPAPQPPPSPVPPPSPPSVKEEAPRPPKQLKLQYVRSVEPYVILADNGEEFRLRGLALPQTSQSESEIVERVLAFQNKFMAGRAFMMEITGETDARGRPLAYAFQEDGHLANAYFLATGYAQVDPDSVPEFTRARLMEMERTAKDARRGCWALEREVSPAR